MRAKEFLSESTDRQIESDLDVISQAADNDPTIASQVKTGLASILAFAKKALGLSKNDQSVQEDLATETTIRELENLIGQLNGQPVVIKQIQAQISKLKNDVINAEKSSYEKAGQEREEGERLVYTLTNQIVEKKFLVAQKESLPVIVSRIESIIRNKEDSFDNVIAFLKDCLNGGVIQTSSMISEKGSSGTIPLTNPAYENLVKQFLMIDEVKVGNAKWGKGEVGLAFCGINAHKEKSDISVGDTHIEVKAGGAKIDFMLKGTKGFGAQKEAVEILITALNKVAKKYNFPIFNNSNEVKNGGIAQLGWRRLNGTKTEGGINDYFAKMGQSYVQKLFVEIINTIYYANPKITKKYEPEIMSSINPDGTVDYFKLSLATSKLNFDYYQSLENHDGLLMLNIATLSYEYQPSRSSKAFGKLVQDKKILPTSALDFRQSTAGSLTFVIR